MLHAGATNWRNWNAAMPSCTIFRRRTSCCPLPTGLRAIQRSSTPSNRFSVPTFFCGSTFIIKEPGDGKKVSWHQDLTYWGLDAQDVVSVWLALSPASVQSSCMISGTQAGPLVAHQENLAADNILSRGQTIAGTVDEKIAVDIVLAPGEMSLHHGRVWHGSNPNVSLIGASGSTPSIWL
jgi:Phytanoyl-CoA dioxygenase (PhyH)